MDYSSSLPDALTDSLNLLKDELVTLSPHTDDDHDHDLSVQLEGVKVLSLRLGELPLPSADIHARVCDGLAAMASSGSGRGRGSGTTPGNASVFCIKLDGVPILQVLSGGERPAFPLAHGGVRKLRATMAAIESELEEGELEEGELEDGELEGALRARQEEGGACDMEVDRVEEEDAVDHLVADMMPPPPPIHLPNEIVERIVTWTKCNDSTSVESLHRLMCVSKQFKYVVTHMSSLSVNMICSNYMTSSSAVIGVDTIRGFTKIPVENLVKVFCSHNRRVRGISMLAALPNLKTLDISGTLVDSLVPFRNGACRDTLQDLFCSQMSIQSIAGIESLGQLRFLDLHETQCSDPVGEFHLPLLTVLNTNMSHRVFNTEFPYFTCFPSLVAFLPSACYSRYLEDEKDNMELLVSNTRDAVNFKPTINGVNT
eukprot:gene10954-biopygen11036